MPRLWGRGTTNHENRDERMLSLESYFRIKEKNVLVSYLGLVFSLARSGTYLTAISLIPNKDWSIRVRAKNFLKG
jgi:hypothetical protein